MGSHVEVSRGSGGQDYDASPRTRARSTAMKAAKESIKHEETPHMIMAHEKSSTVSTGTLLFNSHCATLTIACM